MNKQQCIRVMCKSMQQLGFPGDSVVKNLPANAGATEDVGSITGLARSPGGGNDNLFQYSCLKIPWTEETGGLWSMGSQTVGRDQMTEQACTQQLERIRTYCHRKVSKRHS